MWSDTSARRVMIDCDLIEISTLRIYSFVNLIQEIREFWKGQLFVAVDIEFFVIVSVTEMDLPVISFL